MQRRSFIRDTALGAIAISASGYIRHDGQRYVGDCETTTDIIGPFYRPDSPLRNNFMIPGDPGVPVELSGRVRHNDCVTPYKKAKVELWHCNNSGLYDNESNEYRYRGTLFTDDQGRYSFNSILPIPYNEAGGPYRPAHFHLMITAEGYLPLITQLYFTGDPYLDKDPYSKSTAAQKRILEVQTSADGRKRVLYDISMAEKLNVEPASLDKLAGKYKCLDDEGIICTFFVRNGSLWYNEEFGKKLDPYGRTLQYLGNNTFGNPTAPPPIVHTYVFEISDTGSVKATETFVNSQGKKFVLVFEKGK